MNPPPLPTSIGRSTFVTSLSWLMMIVAVLGLPISVITVAMILVKSYGTQTFDSVGFAIIVLGPATLLATGFGLLKRWRWARGATMVLLVGWMAVNACELIKAPRPTTTYTSSAGVKTTVIGSGTNVTALPIIALCTVLMLKMLSRRVRDEFGSSLLPACAESEPNDW